MKHFRRGHYVKEWKTLYTGLFENFSFVFYIFNIDVNF